MRKGASTYKINEYLNNTQDINDRVQNIINEIHNSKNEKDEHTRFNVKQDVSNIDDIKENKYTSTISNNDRLWLYFNSRTDEEKNKIVEYLNSNNKCRNKGIVAVTLAKFIILVMTFIRSIGFVFAKVLLPKYFLNVLYMEHNCNGVDIDESVEKEYGKE